MDVPPLPFDAEALAAAQTGWATLAGIRMGIGYMSLLIPLASRETLLVRALRNTGKTAFTLYIGQTVVALLVFSIILRPLWGTWSRFPLLMYVVLTAVVRVVFAHWWQARRGMGPHGGYVAAVGCRFLMNPAFTAIGRQTALQRSAWSWSRSSRLGNKWKAFRVLYPLHV